MIASTYESAKKDLVADSRQTLAEGIPDEVLAKEATAHEGRTHAVP